MPPVRGMRWPNSSSAQAAVDIRMVQTRKVILALPGRRSLRAGVRVPPRATPRGRRCCGGPCPRGTWCGRGGQGWRCGARTRGWPAHQSPAPGPTSVSTSPLDLNPQHAVEQQEKVVGLLSRSVSTSPSRSRRILGGLAPARMMCWDSSRSSAVTSLTSAGESASPRVSADRSVRAPLAVVDCRRLRGELPIVVVHPVAGERAGSGQLNSRVPSAWSVRASVVQANGADTWT